MAIHDETEDDHQEGEQSATLPRWNGRLELVRCRHPLNELLRNRCQTPGKA